MYHCIFSIFIYLVGLFYSYFVLIWLQSVSSVLNKYDPKNYAPVSWYTKLRFYKPFLVLLPSNLFGPLATKSKWLQFFSNHTLSYIKNNYFMVSASQVHGHCCIFWHARFDDGFEFSCKISLLQSLSSQVMSLPLFPVQLYFSSPPSPE